MPDTVEFKSRVGPDGTLDLHVALGEAEAGADVVVTIRRASPLISTPTKATDPQEWHRFVEQTYGSCADLGLERQPQGEFENREPTE
jgi:hypothetical protein